jgi:putative addiction module killer protein
MVAGRTVLRTAEFDRWLARRPRETLSIVEYAIDRIADGRFGDIKPLGDGLLEARIFSRGGVRLYFARVGDAVLLILLGGVKDSQSRDIARARRILKDYARGELDGRTA